MRYGYWALVLAGVTAPAFALQDEPQTVSGELIDESSRWTHAFTLSADEIVTLTTRSTDDLDTILSIAREGGKPLAENDDMGDGRLQSRIVFQAPSSGTYVASITGFGGETGVFELDIQPGLDAGLSPAAERLEDRIYTLSAGQPSRDITIELAAEDVLVATTYALSDTLDTVLTLSNARDDQLAQNDDYVFGELNSQLIYQAEEAETVTLTLGSFSGVDEGEVLLSLALDPNADVPFDFTSIEGEPLAQFEGELNNDNPETSYPVELEAGQTLFAMADALSGELDTLLRLEHPDGYPVALNDDRGDGSLNSAFAYTVSQSGTYTLRMQRYQGSETSGLYRLETSLVDASVVDVLQALRENVVDLSGDPQSLQAGDFVVHYTLDGRDASSLEYAQSVGEALEEIYAIQIEDMGWAAPVRDDDGLYHVYIGDADGSMGVAYPVETVFDNPQSPDRREITAARAVFQIENDFAGLDKDAPIRSLMRATATHEFNHVIQFGYDEAEALDWLYESTASWIETVTVGSDQDATDYVETDYEAPHLCWTTSEGGHDYSQWTLLQSMADQYGNGFIVDIWENTVELDGFETVETALRAQDSTIANAIRRWRAQNFARDYDLAPHFNATVAQHSRLDEPGSLTIKGGLEQLGAHYFPVDLDGRYTVSLDGPDSLELVLMGRDGDEIDILHAGQTAVIESERWQNTTLMVFNAAMPEAPGMCEGTGYTLNINASNDRISNPHTRFSARHFEPLSAGSEDDIE